MREETHRQLKNDMNRLFHLDSKPIQPDQIKHLDHPCNSPVVDEDPGWSGPSPRELAGRIIVIPSTTSPP